MDVQRIGILHPGEMGISVAYVARQGGHEVYWISQGRSEQTRARAAKVEMRDAETLANLCSLCTLIVSVCPPEAAEAVAGEVANLGYAGLYLDANAVSPRRAAAIDRVITAAGGVFVDGGIIGGPAWIPGTTLYLSGPRAQEVAACFSAGPMATRVIGDEIGRASALKMCFAAYSKGTTALLCGVLAAAEALGVRVELERQWSEGDPDFPEQAARRARQVTAKAWRFVGEMEEIAATFRGAGVPGEFHDGAALLYRRLAGFKGADATPTLEMVLAALTQASEG